jgi:hypothetical protein
MPRLAITTHSNVAREDVAAIAHARTASRISSNTAHTMKTTLIHRDVSLSCIVASLSTGSCSSVDSPARTSLGLCGGTRHYCH